MVAAVSGMDGRSLSSTSGIQHKHAMAAAIMRGNPVPKAIKRIVNDPALT